MTNQEPPALMLMPEVAEYIRRSEAQLRWLRHQGRGPRSAKVAGRVMYRRVDVERYVEECFAEDPSADRPPEAAI